MNIAQLGDLVTIKGGGTPDKNNPAYWRDGTIPWATVKDFVSTEISSTIDRITSAGVANSATQVIPAGNLIVPTRMAVGKAAVNRIDLAINQDLKALIPRKNVDRDYLLRALIASGEKPERQAGGATVKGITLPVLRALEIPLPPLPEQKRIAAILDQADSLRRLRQRAIDRLSFLLRSTFLNLFGDPVTNPIGFPIRSLPEFYISQQEGTKRGPFRSALKKDELVESGIPVWNMDNIDISGKTVSPFRMWITEEKYKELQTYSVVDGDVLISRAGTVGKMCVADSGGAASIISTNLIRVRFGPDLLPIYFVSLMTYCKGRVGRLKTGPDGAFTHMNTGVLDKLKFPYPPLGLQRRFSAIVKSFEEQRARLLTHLAKLDALFASLQQRAFRGDL